eukprot:scaffold76_cov363-Pavlova_lutheri.AAC.18
MAAAARFAWCVSHCGASLAASVNLCSCPAAATREALEASYSPSAHQGRGSPSTPLRTPATLRVRGVGPGARTPAVSRVARALLLPLATAKDPPDGVETLLKRPSLAGAATKRKPARSAPPKTPEKRGKAGGTKDTWRGADEPSPHDRNAPEIVRVGREGGHRQGPPAAGSRGI